MTFGDDQFDPGQAAGLNNRRNAVQNAPSSESPTSNRTLQGDSGGDGGGDDDDLGHTRRLTRDRNV